jgi:hypothetical protein
MSWKVFAERLETADMNYGMGDPPAHYQSVVFTNDIHLKAVRTWVIMFNSPVFDSLQMKIFQDDGAGSPSDGVVYATMDKVYTLADITTEDYCAKEIYFDNTNAIPLVGGCTYHFMLYAENYTGNSTSHVGWMKYVNDFPHTGYTPNMKLLGVAPYKIAFIGSKA